MIRAGHGFGLARAILELSPGAESTRTSYPSSAFDDNEIKVVLPTV